MPRLLVEVMRAHARVNKYGGHISTAGERQKCNEYITLVRSHAIDGRGIKSGAVVDGSKIQTHLARNIRRREAQQPDKLRRCGKRIYGFCMHGHA